MKIPALPSQHSGPNRLASAAGAPSRADTTSTPKPQSPAQGVTLSTAARELAAAQKSEAPLDLARIQEIRQALDKGALVIRPERIADALLQDALDLLRS